MADDKTALNSEPLHPSESAVKEALAARREMTMKLQIVLGLPPTGNGGDRVTDKAHFDELRVKYATPVEKLADAGLALVHAAGRLVGVSGDQTHVVSDNDILKRATRAWESHHSLPLTGDPFSPETSAALSRELERIKGSAQHQAPPGSGHQHLAHPELAEAVAQLKGAGVKNLGVPSAASTQMRDNESLREEVSRELLAHPEYNNMSVQKAFNMPGMKDIIQKHGFGAEARRYLVEHGAEHISPPVLGIRSQATKERSSER